MEEHLELEGNTQSLSKVKISDHEASLILTAFPGRTSSNTFSMRDMLGVLNALKKESCSYFLSLVEATEFSNYCDHEVLVSESNKRSINFVRLPIVDMGVPKNETLDRLNKLRPSLHEAIKSGSSVAIHCMGGLGRSGTVAGIILRDLGIPAQSAIDIVRQSRPGAIETKEQELFVSSIASNHLNNSE